MKDEKPPSQKKKRSSVRHTRAVQRDRSKRPTVQAPDEQVTQRLHDLVHPATLAQVSHFHQQGLRERTLTLPVMMAFVLSLVWRQVGGVSELARLVQTEALLWVQPRQVSQQALSQRLSTLPAGLFAQVFRTLLPTFHARWSGRDRPLAPELS